MQSSGSTSSHDSLSSSDSFLFSDGEHTEDDSSVFLSESESGGERPSGASYSLNRGSTSSPASQWACDGFGDQERSSLPKSGQVERCPSNASYSALVSSSSEAKVEKEQEGGRMAQTEGDHLFAQKCVELQGFVRPLLDLLSGLQKGRFDRGLSTFQQSVAVDRIQRIVGVLQTPTTGGKYLHTLLQVEMMLKLWFPQICPHAPSTSERLAPAHSTPPHKHRDQLHIPVKKRRLSWSDSPTLPPHHCKRFDHGRPEEGGAGREEGSCLAQPAVSGAQRERGAAGYARPAGEKREGEKSEYKVIRWSELTPILSPPKSFPSHKSRGGTKGGFAVQALSPLSACSSPATQDSSISSTTPFSDPRRLLPRQCQPVACQSEPVATETEDCEGGALNPREGRSQSIPPMLKPLNGAKRVHSA